MHFRGFASSVRSHSAKSSVACIEMVSDKYISNYKLLNVNFGLYKLIDQIQYPKTWEKLIFSHDVRVFVFF